MGNKTLLVFDIDGTLINTEKSYLEAIRLTIEHFLERPIDKQKISEIKMMQGFNNDWLVTYALTNSELTGKEFIDFKNENVPYQKISFLQIKEVFQNFYLGNQLYKEIEGLSPKLNIPNGLWKKETMVFTLEQLSSLKEKYGKLNIITGRTYKEAVHIIKYFKLQDLFDQIISVEDIKEEDFTLHTELQRYGKDKSNPILFYQIKNINNYGLIYYIGDSVSDMELVFNTKSLLSVRGIHILECFPSAKRSEIKQNSAKYSPDLSVNSATEVYNFLVTRN